MGGPRFVDPDGGIDRHGKKLPHWQQGDATVFVTFRLADSLPAPQLAELSEFKANWLRVHGGEWNEELERRWRSEYAREIDAKLDAGHGSCALREPEVREAVVRTLCFGDGDRYRLDAAVVMPNHVHLLFAPLSRPMEREVQAWKSVSSRTLRKAGCGNWPGWQRNFHDRLIRHRRHFDRVVGYIEENPSKARLRDREFWLYLREGVKDEG